MIRTHRNLVIYKKPKKIKLFTAIILLYKYLLFGLYLLDSYSDGSIFLFI